MESVFPCWIWADLQLNRGILSGFWQKKNTQTDLWFCTRQTWSYHDPTKFEFSVKLAYMQAFKTQLFCQVKRLYFGYIWALHIKTPGPGLNPGPVCCVRLAVLTTAPPCSILATMPASSFTPHLHARSPLLSIHICSANADVAIISAGRKTKHSTAKK